MRNKLKVLFSTVCCAIAINNNGYSMFQNSLNNNNGYSMFPNSLIDYKQLLKTLETVEKINKLSTTGKHKGLVNIGNTCYMNVALQGMASQRSFVRQFFRHVINKFKQIDTMQYTNENVLTLEFANIMANLWGYNNINNPSYNDFADACNFKIALGNVNNNFALFGPNDAKDVLIQMLDSLHNVLSSNKLQKYYLSTNRQECLNNICKDYISQDKSSPVFNYFYYILENQYLCNNCKAPLMYIFSSENFYILHLKQVSDIKYNTSYNMFTDYTQQLVTLFDCFNTQIQNEQRQSLLYNITCQNCLKQTNNVIYRTSFVYTPAVFVFILNRGPNNLYKVPLEIPLTIDLGNFVTEENQKNESKYFLSTVVYLVGESGPNGHFIAVGRTDEDKNWYRYNDAEVSEFDENNLTKLLKNQYYEFDKFKAWPYVLLYTNTNISENNNLINNNIQNINSNQLHNINIVNNQQMLNNNINIQFNNMNNIQNNFINNFSNNGNVNQFNNNLNISNNNMNILNNMNNMMFNFNLNNQFNINNNFNNNIMNSNINSFNHNMNNQQFLLNNNVINNMNFNNNINGNQFNNINNQQIFLNNNQNNINNFI